MIKDVLRNIRIFLKRDDIFHKQLGKDQYSWKINNDNEC